MSKENILLCFSLVLFLVLTSFTASALTASLGSPGVVVRGNVGDKITKYVIVKNVNDVPVNVTLSVSGNLTQEIELQEKNFILDANEDKNAYFIVNVLKGGTYQSKINVAFAPADKIGNGVGLHFEVVLVASGEGEAVDVESEGNVDSNSEEAEENDITEITGNIIGSKKLSGGVIALLATSAVLLVLLIMLIFFIKKNKKEKKGEIDSFEKSKASKLSKQDFEKSSFGNRGYSKSSIKTKRALKSYEK